MSVVNAILASMLLAGMFIFRIRHAELTDIQMLLRYWWMYLIILVLVIFGSYKTWMQRLQRNSSDFRDRYIGFRGPYGIAKVDEFGFIYAQRGWNWSVSFSVPSPFQGTNERVRLTGDHFADTGPWSYQASTSFLVTLWRVRRILKMSAREIQTKKQGDRAWQIPPGVRHLRV